MVFPTGAQPHFLVIVPGYMGSLLKDKHTGETVWLDVPALLRNPTRIDDILAKLKYPNDDLEPAGIMERGILYALPWGKLDHYGRLMEHLRQRGFEIDPVTPAPNRTPVYRFAYDWRQDNRLSARQLGEAVRKWRAQNNSAKAWIIGHSNGGIVSRWYIEKEGGKEDVEKLFLMGSPWDGSPKSMRVLFEGYNVVGRQLLNVFGFTRILNEIIRTFPSFYQLIPHETSFLSNAQNQAVNPFTDANWLPGDRDREYLKDGLQFNQDLGKTLSVETICYFGRMKPTTTAGVIEAGPGGAWEKIQWVDTQSGDGTVPEKSAVHPQAKERHAFAVDHGSIYIDQQVLAQLDFDLSGGLHGLGYASVLTENLSIEFDTNQDFYTPGEPVSVYARIFNREEPPAPVTDAKVDVWVSWREPLPGDEVGAASGQPAVKEPVHLSLIQAQDEPGVYRAELPAPQQEGFYTLRCRIQMVLQPTLEIEETIAVERVPEVAPDQGQPGEAEISPV